MCMEKQEKKQKKILTENRLITINRRERSYEGLVTQLANGEDGIYNIASKPDKNVIFQPKIAISKENLIEIPFLSQMKEAIANLEQLQKKSSGKQLYIIKKAIIELRKDQYLIKQAYLPPVGLSSTMKYMNNYIKLEDKSTIDADGNVTVKGISLMDSSVCSAILRDYSRLKENAYGRFEGDTWYLMESFDAVADKALRYDPICERIATYKIDGLQNKEIQHLIEEEFGKRFSLEHISNLWRSRIPKLIAKTAKEQVIYQWAKENDKPFKKCSKCGQKKPTRIEFFSTNNAAKDHFYSICKECRIQRR